MKNSQQPDGPEAGRRAEAGQPQTASRDAPQPWRWKPEYWERYWRQPLAVGEAGAG